jgi:hypothetical protein
MRKIGKSTSLKIISKSKLSNLKIKYCSEVKVKKMNMRKKGTVLPLIFLSKINTVKMMISTKLLVTVLNKELPSLIFKK